MSDMTESLGSEIERYFDRLWSVWPPRSLTGDGVRKTHDILEEASSQKFTRIEVPSGTKVFDWTVPKEWALKEAHVTDPNGNRIIDAAVNHLHVVNYAQPFRGRCSRDILNQRLHSIPEQPRACPYVTRYYEQDWGFCLPHEQRQALIEGDYQVVIDAEHFDGSLSISELVLPGTTDREILLWSYSCHPAGAHHDLSANLAWAFLARRVAAWKERRYTYRFVIGPETIGSLAYLAQPVLPEARRYAAINDFAAHPEGAFGKAWHMAQHLRLSCVSGFVMTCLGRGAWNYKRSKRGDTIADRAAEYVLYQRYVESEAIDYYNIQAFYADKGSDELQFCSQGIDLPVGSLMRLPYGHRAFREYHTSLDDKSTISFDTIANSVDVYERVLLTLEANRTYRATITHGMPQLGRRGLYDDPEAITPLIQFSDGRTDLLAIATRTGIDLHRLAKLAERAVAAKVLEEV